MRAFVLSLFIVLQLPVFADEIKVLGVEFEKHKLYDKYIIRTSGEINPKAKVFDTRLVVDFKGAEVEKSQKIPIGSSVRVASVRMGQFSIDPMIARVVFDLKHDINFETASILGKGEVIVEISDNKNGKGEYAQKPDATPKSNEVEVVVLKPAIKTKKIATIEAVAAKKVPQAKKISEPENKKKPAAARRLPLKGVAVVVDPGHGGEDPGAIGPGGVWEKVINLKTAFYLVDYLRGMGAKVYMTRKTDIRIKLSDIVDYTEQVRADAYVGVHFNSMDNPKISGTETHYYTGQSYGLAESIQKKLLRGIRRDDRGIKRTMLFTIHHSKMPAVIVEPIYMTHFQDGLLIKSPAFQKEVARDIALGVEDFFNGR